VSTRVNRQKLCFCRMVQGRAILLLPFDSEIKAFSVIKEARMI